jgi:hypothetical protein
MNRHKLNEGKKSAKAHSRVLQETAPSLKKGKPQYRSGPVRIGLQGLSSPGRILHFEKG